MTPMKETGTAGAPRSPSLGELVARWRKARADAAEAGDQYGAADKAVCAMAPPYPADCKAWDSAQAEEARAALAAAAAEATRSQLLPRPASFAAWQTERAAIEATFRLDLLDAAALRASETALEIGAQVLTTPALTLADLALKAVVIEAHLADDDFDHSAAIAALATITVDLRAITAPTPAASQETLEAYNAWLFMERRLLALEMYPEFGTKAERFVPCGNPGDVWHFRDPTNWRERPQPSTRAAAVLHAVGVLPESAAEH